MTVIPPAEPSLITRAINSDRVAEARLAQRIGRMPFFRNAAGSSSSTVEIEGRRYLNFGSNNYQDLANDPHVIAAVHEAVDHWGAGTTGSRLLSGSTQLHVELEREICEFYGKPAALVFPTGYSANLGFLAALLRPGDQIAADEDIHASCRDGIQLAHADLHKFAHNDPGELERLLAAHPEIRMCAIEGVYSMRGDVAPVRQMAELCRDRGVMIFIDEAHGLGTLGPSGAGATEEAAALDLADAITITFSKSLGGCGGAVVGSAELIEALRYLARPFIFTASNTPGSVAGALAALRILRAHPGYVQDLVGRVAMFSTLLDQQGVPHLATRSPIFILPAGSDFATVQAWKMLWNRGISANAATSPALPPSEAGIRMSLLRNHTDEQLAEAARICAAVFSEIL